MDSKGLLVLIAGCFVNANPYAIAMTFGTLYVPLLEKFQEDRAKTATVQALLIGLIGSTGVIWGLLCKKFGVWKVMVVGSVLIPLGYILSFFAEALVHVIICIGILAGIGTSIGYVCSSAAVAQVFEDKRAGIALAVHSSAVGIGVVVYPFLMDFLQNMYGIKGTFLLMGGVNLNNLAVSLVCYYNVQVGEQSETDQSVENSEVNTNDGITSIFFIKSAILHIKRSLSRFMNYRLIIIIFTTSITNGCVNGFMVVILDMFKSKGFSTQESLYLLTVSNVCGIIGRLLPVLSQLKNSINIIAIIIICTICGCAGQVVFWKTFELSLMFIGSALFGITRGGVISGSTVALVQFVHKEHFVAAFGLMATLNGVVANITGPLYGWMRDEWQSYDVALLLTISMFGLAALLLLTLINGIKTGRADKEPSVPGEINLE